ncbi:amino acid ABC transporter permease [Maritalea mediterranea]|uniref:Amino acid ABC transporter permease n=1 Tax=Maritalea mediterranea TaxID=2909667 RepID=A0ABS9E8L5_9HYPH|nr:amino acid ABC transporter permease [Maritalea mediterranea]MCF4098249.1 amino acid ABC transporter permease [Maritalea mediterranea]
MAKSQEQLQQRRSLSSLIYDPQFRSYAFQILLLVVLVGFGWWIVQNTIANLQAQNKTTGFDFLDSTAGFDIGFSLIPYSRASTYLDVFYVGILNTLLVAITGIVLATMLGFVIGIARLSSNWIIARLATIYIEVIRNLPLLLQLFFWYFAVLKSMPSVRDSLEIIGGSVYLNNRGLYLPDPNPNDAFMWVQIAVVLVLIGGFFLQRWSIRRVEETGQRFPYIPVFIGLLIVVPTLTWFVTGAALDVNYPELNRFNFQGGIQLPPEFVALLFGLVIYTAAFIAEIVRAGIVSVSSGQTEAAQSLGLKDRDRLNLVVIPQAMRVIVPPLTSQYLNLTKNSSLAVAIGYPDIVNVFMGTALNQSGKAVEVIFMTMAVYLTFSLLTSIIMNWYNARIALTER